MRAQKLVAIVVMTVAGFFTSVSALDSQAAESQLISKGGPVQPYHSKAMREKCHGLSKDMYEFGAQLNESNQKMFCAKFTDEQRKKAMQIASEKGWTGSPKMTPDQAVEKVAKEVNSNTEIKQHLFCKFDFLPLFTLAFYSVFLLWSNRGSMSKY